MKVRSIFRPPCYQIYIVIKSSLPIPAFSCGFRILHQNICYFTVGKTRRPCRMDGCCRTNFLLVRSRVRKFNPLFQWKRAQEQLLHGRNHGRTGELRNLSVGQHNHVFILWFQG